MSTPVVIALTVVAIVLVAAVSRRRGPRVTHITTRRESDQGEKGQ